MTVEEYVERSGREWFLTGKKKYTIQAMMVSKETSFHNSLEETDYTVTDDGETVVLRGILGEMWTSKIRTVVGSYTKENGTALREEDFAEKDVYIRIVSIPSADTNYAMFVPQDIVLNVEIGGGNELHTNQPGAAHGDGDYLVCRAGKDGRPDLSSVWVLNGVLFPCYYRESDRM